MYTFVQINIKNLLRLVLFSMEFAVDLLMHKMDAVILLRDRLLFAANISEMLKCSFKRSFTVFVDCELPLIRISNYPYIKDSKVEVCKGGSGRL